MEGGALEVLFTGVHSPDVVQKRLQAHEDILLKRTQVTQCLSSSFPPGRRDEFRVKAEEIEGEDRLPPINDPPFSGAWCDFFFTFDVQDRARKAMDAAGWS